MSILTSSYTLAIVAGAMGLLGVLLLVLSGTWVIAENQSGLVIKRFGPPLASGQIIALDGEAGYQARMLPPGWHFWLWRWRYKVVKVPVVVVQPGEIALVVAADGRADSARARARTSGVAATTSRTPRRFFAATANAAVSSRS